MMGEQPPPPPVSPPAPPPLGVAGQTPSPPQAFPAAGYPVPQLQNVQMLPVHPSTLATPARRFAGFLLSFVLTILTLVIGYLIWAIIAWTKSATPAKQLLGMRVIDSRSGAPATFGQMVMRQVVWTLVLGLASAVTGGILGIVDALFVFGGTRQRLLDRMAGTLVIKI